MASLLILLALALLCAGRWVYVELQLMDVEADVRELEELLETTRRDRDLAEGYASPDLVIGGVTYPTLTVLDGGER